MRRTAGKAALCLLLAAAPAAGADQELQARYGAVASIHPLASAAGAEILKAGGNAVDAAVATAFALAVVHPAAGNLGGGGFLVAWLPGRGPVALDFRETAPRAARRDMYLDPQGRPRPEASLVGFGAAGVPGSPAGLLLALEQWGRLSRVQVLAPAIRLARGGFPLDDRLARSLARERKDLCRFPATAQAFFPAGRPADAGERWRQPDLAATLERLRDGGRDGFYRGETARLVAEACREGGGWITDEDLAAYTPKLREPLSILWRGYRVLTMPPPSAGGVALAQMLAFLDPHLPRRAEPFSAREIHVIAEAMRLAFADRAAWLGDPDHWPVPLAGLLDQGYLRARASLLRPDRRALAVAPGRPPGAATPPGSPAPREGGETTHLCAVDRWGGAVALTTTLNSSFGCLAVVPGAGFLLNNEMDDFSAAPGQPNQFGLVGAEANAIAPGKRMLSSMTPTIVLGEGRVELVLGSPGGSRIPNAVLLVLLHRLVLGMDLAGAVAAPRFHHQWLPDRLRLEPFAFAPEILDRLTALGWRLEPIPAVGRCHAIGRLPSGGWVAVADPRGGGAAAGY